MLRATVDGNGNALVSSETVKVGRRAAAAKVDHGFAFASLPVDLEAEGSKHFTVGLHNDGESLREFSRRRSGDGDGFVVDVRDLNRRMVERSG